MSVMMPIAWALPRSASLVTVAGLMSTQTSGIDAGRMFPVAIECSIVATMIAKPTSGQLRAHRPLALDHVGVDVGQRAVVAHRADQHERLVRPAPSRASRRRSARRTPRPPRSSRPRGSC